VTRRLPPTDDAGEILSLDLDMSAAIALTIENS
jgi:hypothetical protein